MRDRSTSEDEVVFCILAETEVVFLHSRSQLLSSPTGTVKTMYHGF